VDILTLFPEMFAGFTSESIIRIAREKGLLEVRLTNIRDFATGRHKKVDDTPYGGGPGMVMMVPPVAECLDAVKERDRRGGPVILLTPQGRPFRQETARRLSRQERIILLCGHYEGVDERVRSFVDEEISVGDYVLTGGELPAMVVTDAVVRLLPGVLGDETSPHDESFSAGLLEYPQYTRPQTYRGMSVPEVLLSGHHAEIERWRREQSLERTEERRPDLDAGGGLS
jgi:tRNA (guanine37-N1)-methyltransferase